MLLTEIGTISQLVTTIGFPIVMCGAMAYYVKYITDKQREERQQMVEAVNNNTLAIQKLCVKLGEEDVA